MASAGDASGGTDRVYCLGCGAEIGRLRAKVPCPECGGMARRYTAHEMAGERAGTSARVSRYWLQIKQQPPWRLVGLSLGVLGVALCAILGPFVALGTAIGGVVLVLATLVGERGRHGVRRREDLD